MPAEPSRDYTPYVEYARAQSAGIREESRQRYDRAHVVARDIASFLREKYHPTRILAFGSLLHPDVFHLRSDIDIAVEGIPWPEYLRAWIEAQDRAAGFRVDLIDLACASESLKAHALAEGRPL